MEIGAGSGIVDDWVQVTEPESNNWVKVSSYTGFNRTFTKEHIDTLKEEVDKKIQKLKDKKESGKKKELGEEEKKEIETSIQTLKITRDSLDAHNNPFKNIISKQRAAEEAPTPAAAAEEAPTPAAAANDNQKGGSRSKKGKSRSKKGKSHSKKGKSRSKKGKSRSKKGKSRSKK